MRINRLMLLKSGFVGIATATILIVAGAATAAPMDQKQLTTSLAAIARSAPDPSTAKDDLAKYHRLWVSIGELPEQQQILWINTFSAVIERHARAVRDSQRERGSQRTSRPAQPKPEIRKQAHEYYRELLAATDSKTDPPRLIHHIKRALAVTTHDLAMQMHGEQRTPLLNEAIGQQEDLAQFWESVEQEVMAAGAHGQLGHLYFVSSDEEKAVTHRKRAIQLYESLPETFLDTADLGLEDSAADRVAEWSRRGYSLQSEIYLLEALSLFNRGVDQPEYRRESIYLFAESLRVGMVHGNTTAVSNVGALLLLRAGQETGRTRQIRYLLTLLDVFSSPASNPHWRGRNDLTKSDEAFQWIQARARGYLGDFYSETGQTLLARFQFNEAARLAQNLKDRTVLPLGYLAQARQSQRMGLFDESLQYSRKALDASPGLGLRSRILLHMGGVWKQQGEYALARDHVRWAMDLFVKPGSFTLRREDLTRVAEIRAALAEMELALGNSRKALSALHEAAEFSGLADPRDAIKFHLKRLRIARAVSNRARYNPSKQLAAALESAPRSVIQGEMFAARGLNLQTQPIVDFVASGKPAVPPPPGAARLDRRQARLLSHGLVQLDSEPAAEVIQESTEAVDRLLPRARPNLRNDLSDQFLLAKIAIHQGHTEKANQLLDDILDTHWTYTANRLDPTLGIESPQFIHEVHHTAARLEIERDNPFRALQILDMSRHTALLFAQASHGKVWNRLTDEEQVEAARLDDTRTQLQRQVTSLSRQLADQPKLALLLKATQAKHLAAEADWIDFKTEIRTRYSVETPPHTPVDRAVLESLLEPQQMVVTYSVGEFETCAVVAIRDQDGLRLAGHVVPIRRAELKALVTALRMGCVRPDGSWKLLARELYEVLLAPLEQQLSAARMVIIGPDGPLNELPFAVLLDPRDRPLLQRAPLCITPSIALLQRLRTAESSERSGALLVGVSNFDDRLWIPSLYASQLGSESLQMLLPHYRLGELKNTVTEIDRIGQLFGTQSIRLVDSQATEQAVVAAAAGKRYLHFATHGLMDSHNPFESALVLAASPSGSNEDGFLEAAEILESEAFVGAELVTLSACETGLGMIQGTEGVLGLSWAFLAAGNRSTLVSLWNVDDQATAELMVHLYQELHNGADKATALRRAALALRADEKTNHPARWAAFQLIGDPMNQSITGQ